MPFAPKTPSAPAEAEAPLNSGENETEFRGVSDQLSQISDLAGAIRQQAEAGAALTAPARGQRTWNRRGYKESRWRRKLDASGSAQRSAAAIVKINKSACTRIDGHHRNESGIYRRRRSAQMTAANPIAAADRALPVAVIISAGVMALPFRLSCVTP